MLEWLRSDKDEFRKWAKCRCSDVILEEEELMHLVKQESSLNYLTDGSPIFKYRLEMRPFKLVSSDNPAIIEVNNFNEEIEITFDLPDDEQIEMFEVLLRDIDEWRENKATQIYGSANGTDLSDSVGQQQDEESDVA